MDRFTVYLSVVCLLFAKTRQFVWGNEKLFTGLNVFNLEFHQPCLVFAHWHMACVSRLQSFFYLVYSLNVQIHNGAKCEASGSLYVVMLYMWICLENHGKLSQHVKPLPQHRAVSIHEDTLAITQGETLYKWDRATACVSQLTYCK